MMLWYESLNGLLKLLLGSYVFIVLVWLFWIVWNILKTRQQLARLESIERKLDYGNALLMAWREEQKEGRA